MFTSFKIEQKSVNGIKINYRIGGDGPPLLLLHGHPQTHVIWHKVADKLAANFTVVAADLRGYGDSDKPALSEQAQAYSKREMAKDQVELMEQLGFNHFSLIAHDRGARVAHRMQLDHPQSIKRMVLLDIAPTLSMYRQTNEEFARAYWHWFFLIRPAPLPESLIEADPENYLRSVMGTRSAKMAPFTDDAFAEYLRCISLSGAARGICEDYRASASIDLVHDQQDVDSHHKVSCPLMVLWGEHGTVGKCFDPIAEWQKVAVNVCGGELPSGHYIPEEAPELLLERVSEFFANTEKESFN
ncbi:MAG: alpha/beta hydrolase [Alteromonadaceae bacterium]|jgi:haloacetate dehalogenase|nr:alpha/beta hydrolase [Alteromonadaceae bacterium]MBB19288.1 alpha/beta hydrolase [Rickettsiales bacterium]